MNTNKTLLGGLAGGVTFFLLGGLIYGVLLKNFMSENCNQSFMRPMEEMIWWAMILSNLAQGFFLAIIIGWSKDTGLMSGAKMGGIIGLLLGLSIDTGFYAMSTMFLNPTAMLVDIIAVTVMTAIGGAVIGWVMGMGKKEA